MNENVKAPPSLQHIPRKSEMVPVANSGNSLNIRPQIARALDDDAVIKQMEPYKLNGGKCGNHRIDDIRTMDLVIAYDTENGSCIKKLLAGDELKEDDVLRQVNVEMRVRYTLDKHHKIIGLNPKRYRLLGN